MSIISEKFNAKISSLRNDFEVNRDIVHNGVKGGLNEIELSSIIKEVTPQKYKIAKCVIVVFRYSCWGLRKILSGAPKTFNVPVK